MSSDTPRTAAGRELLTREAYNSRSFALITAEAIVAIEDDAREQALAEAEEALMRFRLPNWNPRTVVASLRKPVQPKGQE